MFRWWWHAALVAVSLAGTPRAGRATEIEPDGTMVPQAVPDAELMSVAFMMPTPALRLDQLVVARGEMLESRLDAHVPLGGFEPLCNLTAQLLLRGGTCEVGFGWYNVMPGRTMPPTAAEIYPLIAANDPIAMPRPDYTPGVGAETPVVTIAKLRADPHYAGGLIGFATMGDDRKTPAVCTQPHFTEPALNPLCTTAACMNKPWIAALSYASTVTPNSYYFLFEEKPMSATAFGNDGDFNDQVFVVAGVTCPGGGQPCATGKNGVCARGLTVCDKGGKVTCGPDVVASAEICDGLDNDCDGVVDRGATCADAAHVCDRGRCVPVCDPVAAPCPEGSICDGGVCKPATCAGVVCAAGQVCWAGACQDGCVRGTAPVVCPHGQLCRVGRCVDPCEGITCAAGQVCEDGACVAPCTCRSCPTGKSCTRDERCVETGCQNTSCGDGMICNEGQCRDLCYSTLCPYGQYCAAGQCVPMPLAQPVSTGGVTGIFDAGLGGMTVDAALDVASDEEGDAEGAAISACTCQAGAPGRGSLAALVAVAFILTARRRQRGPAVSRRGR